MTTTSDYEFDLGGGDTVAADRNDLDLVVGAAINETVSLFMGYKNMSSTMAYDTVAFGAFDIDVRINAMLIGIGAGVPIGDSGIILSGNLSYGQYNIVTEEDGYTLTDEDDSMTAVEIAATYIASDRLFLSLGYKHQDFNPEDTFAGPTIAVDYRL